MLLKFNLNIDIIDRPQIYAMNYVGFSNKDFSNFN